MCLEIVWMGKGTFFLEILVSIIQCTIDINIFIDDDIIITKDYLAHFLYISLHCHKLMIIIITHFTKFSVKKW